MRFRLVKISGVDDAIISLFLSKRSYTPEKADEVRSIVAQFSDVQGFIHLPETETPESKKLINWLTKITKYGDQLGYKKNHETMLKFIDFTVETIGLHKAGMGDLDAHAQRMNNRIVRSSSRLAEFSYTEKSDYYQGKILSLGEAMSASGEIKVPDTVTINGEKFKFNGFGYVREDCWDKQDVQRGTYMLSIPSNAIWKADYVGMKHIYAMRNKHTYAHPELAEGMEQLAEQIEQTLPVLGISISHEWVLGEWVHVSETKLSK